MSLVSGPEMIGFATMGISLVTIVGFSLKNARDESDKRGRIYERLDEEKDEIKRTYVRKDIHDVKYERIESDVSEIKTDVKKILQKNGIS